MNTLNRRRIRANDSGSRGSTDGSLSTVPSLSTSISTGTNTSLSTGKSSHDVESTRAAAPNANSALKRKRRVLTKRTDRFRPLHPTVGRGKDVFPTLDHIIEREWLLASLHNELVAPLSENKDDSATGNFRDCVDEDDDLEDLLATDPLDFLDWSNKDEQLLHHTFDDGEKDNDQNRYEVDSRLKVQVPGGFYTHVIDDSFCSETGKGYALTDSYVFTKSTVAPNIQKRFYLHH